MPPGEKAPFYRLICRCRPQKLALALPLTLALALTLSLTLTLTLFLFAVSKRIGVSELAAVYLEIPQHPPDICPGFLIGGDAVIAKDHLLPGVISCQR